jgi:citrate lyase subunit beta/citryl-CoA lyase
MRLRSLLFVPGYRPERFAKAAATGADALILDLEDSVVEANKAAARSAIADLLAQPRTGTRLFVRVNPLDSPYIADDLAAISGSRPDAIVLPKPGSSADVRELNARVRAIAAESIPVLPIGSETPAAVFGLGTYGEVRSLVVGLTWGAEDLPAAIGAATSRNADGTYTAPYEMVRSLVLFGAHAAGVPAIETVFPDFRNLEGLRDYALRGARDGFTGMMAIHPAQVALINDAFTPSAEAVAHAHAIVAAFAANPGAGALQLDGKMIDAPHLKQARRILDLAAG